MTRATRYARRSNRYCEKDMKYFELSSTFFSSSFSPLDSSLLEITDYFYRRSKNDLSFSPPWEIHVLEDSLVPIITSLLCFILLVK